MCRCSDHSKSYSDPKIKEKSTKKSVKEKGKEIWDAVKLITKK